MTLYFPLIKSDIPKIRYKITSKSQRKVLHKKLLQSLVFFIGDKTTGIVNKY